jgi:Secretion system C-terminal sorting domain
MKMKKTNQLTVTFIIALFLVAGFTFASFGQESEKKKEKKVIEIVEDENGIERRATGTFEDGEWSYEGNSEMIEKLKTQISEQKEGKNHFIFRTDDGETRVVKQVSASDGEEHNVKVEVIIGEGEVHQKMMFVDDEGNVTHINTEGGDGDYTWVQDENENGNNKIIIVSGDMEEMAEQKMKNIRVLVEDGASKEDIMKELDIRTEEENVYITIEKTVDVEVENGEESKSETIVLVIKQFKLEKIGENEIPKSMKKGFSINEEGSLQKVNFYPNPSDGEFSVQASVDSDAPVNILITDLDGKTISSEGITGHGGTLDYKIDIKDKSPGMYLVRVSQNGEAVVRKIVVK